MGRLAMFLEGFAPGTKVNLYSKNGKLVFSGVKEDIPHRFEDQVNILLGTARIGDHEVSISINYDDEEQ